MTKFSPKWTGKFNDKFQTVDAWCICQYPGPGTATVVESLQFWETKAEAQAAADRANAGDEEGLTFASYSDD